MIATTNVVADINEWLCSPRFEGISRLHTAQQVAEQCGTIANSYAVSSAAAEAFHARLRRLFDAKQSITTFGPYSPGQAVVMKRLGIEAIYLGGWATSAKGSVNEDPGADLASYPLSQVPDEASSIVRALLTADRNQHFARLRMTGEEQRTTPAIDYRPFIIADADTGHGGDAHIRNLIRRFVEVGVPGYHIEDQKPGVKKCGHQGGKVLVSQNEQIQRLNAARFQLDIMRVPGILVARTDAEAASLLESNTDERDQPFILGATSMEVPSYKAVVVATHRKLFELGAEVRGHLMFELSDAEYESVEQWLTDVGLTSLVRQHVEAIQDRPEGRVESLIDTVLAAVVERWQARANLKTYREAVSDAIADRLSEGEDVGLSVAEWLRLSKDLSLAAARQAAAAIGVSVAWDCELARTPEGYYQVQGGIEYAVAKSLASAPFADILWMETNTANLDDARTYAEAIHSRFPSKMLAYNLSPSFNWDSTGMTDEEMTQFPRELGKLGFVFNFITYGGHQIDGLAAEEFATALLQEGMLALARVQRKLRLSGSPYRTPQTLAGGPRLDAALMAASGRTATTRAMGKGSTQHQHLRETELLPRVLDGWLRRATSRDRSAIPPRASLRPAVGGADLVELRLLTDSSAVQANVVFAELRDRLGNRVLSIREFNIFDPALRETPCMALAHLFLAHRYRASAVQYLSPTEEECAFSVEMARMGVFLSVSTTPSQFAMARLNSAALGKFQIEDTVNQIVDAWGLSSPAVPAGLAGRSGDSTR